MLDNYLDFQKTVCFGSSFNFKIREPSVSKKLVFQNPKTASFSSLKKIRIKEPTILAI